jgi:hypothetical protein
MLDVRELINLAGIALAVLLASALPFQFARRRIGNLAAFVGLALGIFVGGIAGFLYLAWPNLNQGRSWPSVFDELTTVGRGFFSPD